MGDSPRGRPLDRAGAARPRAGRGLLRVLGRADRHLRRAAGLSSGARGGPGEGRHRRVGAHRSRAGARSAGGGRGERVPVPGRLDRAGRGAAHHQRRTPRDRRGPARARHDGQRRDPDAGRHAGLRADGGDLARADGAPSRRPALPRLPAAPDHGRRLRVVGLAGARHGRGARRAHRVPRAEGLRGAQRDAVPRGRPGGGEPLRPRRHRRRRHRGGAARAGRRGARHPGGPAVRAAVAATHRRAGPRPRRLGRDPGDPRRGPDRRPRRPAAGHRGAAAAVGDREGRAGQHRSWS